MKVVFKKCPQCGYVHLSKHETEILNNLPATAKKLGSIFNISRKQAHVELTRLEQLGVIYRNGYDQKSIIFDRVN